MSNNDDRTRGRVAVILAATVGLGVLLLVAAALWDVYADDGQHEISATYASLVQTTLGVLVGGLVGYLGGVAHESRDDDEDDA